MNNFIAVTKPYPAHIFAVTHPWHKYISSAHTDIRKTLERNEPIRVCAIWEKKQ